MKIKTFLYAKSETDKKTRSLLVTTDSDTYVEGFDLQDLEAVELAALEQELQYAKEAYDEQIKEIIKEFDLNMFRRFLKSKISEIVS